MRPTTPGMSPTSRLLRVAGAVLCGVLITTAIPPRTAMAGDCRSPGCNGQRCAGKGCGGKACCPHCPVRPAEFGFYGTQWRRWPTPGQPSRSPTTAPLPAVPPPSVIPGIDEESPRRGVDPLPDTGAGPGTPALPLPPGPEAGPDRSGAAPTRDQRRAALVSEATAARTAAPAQQEEFARRLVGAVLSEHDPAIRSLIVETAGGLQAPSAIAICKGAVADPDAAVRMAACNAWMQRGGAEAVQVLAQRCREDDDLGVRLRALRALGELDDKTAIPVVVTALDDPDPAVQSRAMQVLRKLTGRNLGNDPQAWRTWAANPEGKSSWNIAEALRRMF